MDFRIADTFTDSLAHLTAGEQKAVKTTAFDLQMNPANPGMSFHKLDKTRDKHFWSVRVSRDIRLIVHRTPQSLLLCFVDHHDAAYRWAESRKIETHPKTGAAQIVKIRERVEEIRIPRRVERQPRERVSMLLFEAVADSDLLSWGVPREWLAEVRAVDSEDELLALADHLPAEAAEALLELATGRAPKAPAAMAAALTSVCDEDASIDHLALEGEEDSVITPAPDAFIHPDAQRRFRTIQSREELERALDAPWDRWTIFLHPGQREWVERSFNGPARVSGSAGTGKTIVALYRAVHLAIAVPESRVLLTTFSTALASALRIKLRRLIGNQPRLGERIDVDSMDTIGKRLYERTFGKVNLASDGDITALLADAASRHPGPGVSAAFLRSEWDNVVDAWQLTSWEAYRDVQRLGRRTRLPESRRKVLWEIFAGVLVEMKVSRQRTVAGMFGKVADDLAQRQQPPFDFAIVDEAQDISVAQLRFLAALAGARPNGLFFAGDLGQRIFQQPFSWKSQGVDVRGRSRTLHVNYRTSARSVPKPIDCSIQRLPTWMAISRHALERFRPSVVPTPISAHLMIQSPNPALPEPGSQLVGKMACSLRRSRCLCARPLNSSARRQPSSRPAWSGRYSMSACKWNRARSQSAPCTWPRDSNSGR